MKASIKICLNCKWHSINPGMGNVLCNNPHLPNRADALNIRGRFQSAFAEEITRKALPELCEHEGKWFEAKK